MDAPQTDINDLVISHGVEVVDEDDGTARIVRHLVLQSAEIKGRVLNGGRRVEEAVSWHGPVVRLGSGCGNAVSCPKCRAEMKRRHAARAALREVS